jgi:hypothetical protein
MDLKYFATESQNDLPIAQICTILIFQSQNYYVLMIKPIFYQMSYSLKLLNGH